VNGSPLKFEDYSVNSISFILNHDYVENEVDTITVNPQFTINFFKSVDEEKTFKVVINCKVFDNAKEINAPFTVNSEIEGYFSINKETEDEGGLIKYNAVATLLPYLRAIISQTTSLAGCPPLNIPLINVHEVYNEDNK
jgi:preprotein translocase subunit SecB